MLLLLFALWLILNGRLTAEIALTGAGATLLAFAFAARFLGWSLRREFFLWKKLPLLIGIGAMILYEIIKANLRVARAIYFERPTPVVRTIHTRLKTRMARALYANSITLTPGTITLELSGDELTVHCLTRDLAEGLSHSRIEDALLRLEAGKNG